MPAPTDRALTLAGAGLALTGVAHFVAPERFDVITRGAFPDDTRAWTFRNGALETVLGTGVAVASTRRAALVGVAAYVGWIGLNAARHR